MRSSASLLQLAATVSSGQISSRTNARIQSSCSSNSGSVEKSHAIAASIRQLLGLVLGYPNSSALRSTASGALRPVIS